METQQSEGQKEGRLLGRCCCSQERDCGDLDRIDELVRKQILDIF